MKESELSAKLPDHRVSYPSDGATSSLGLMVQARASNEDNPEQAGSDIQIRLPRQWHTLTRFETEAGALQIVAAGHLYAREARSLDVLESLEILSKHYARGGFDAVRAAIGGGMFGLLLVDLRESKLYATCDFLACFPLFHRISADGVTIVTNQLDLLGTESLSRDACLEYLAFGYLPFSPSLFQTVQRLGPGQVLAVNLAAPGRAEVSPEELPSYAPLGERIANPRDACERLDEQFTRYFERLGDAPAVAGLSGGYDSRLIAAYTSAQRCQLATFDNPQTDESTIARRVAESLGKATRAGQIPADAPSRSLPDFIGGMQTYDSLEMSHVFGSLDLLDKGEPAFLFDGFLGGEAMGSHYFYRLAGGMEPLWRVLLCRDGYGGAPATNGAYSARLAGLYNRRLTSAQLESLGLSAAHFNGILERMVDDQRASCFSDADMLELLSYRLRTRRVIAGGPVTFLRRRFTLVPFYDRDIFDTCLLTAKSLRAGDRLYNAFWRHRFPDLAAIPKESTGGRASQGDIGYRMTHFGKVLLRRVKQRLPARLRHGGKTGGDVAGFQAMFRHEPANQAVLSNLLEQAAGQFRELDLPNPVDFANATEDDSLYLRLASLAALLTGPAAAELAKSE